MKIINELTCAKIASAAYGDKTQIKGTPLESAKHLKFHDEEESQAFTGTFGDLTFVAIRGTDSRADAKVDSEFHRVPFRFIKKDCGFEYAGTGKVHRGVLRHTAAIINRIVKAVMGHGNNRVLITGHSLGGGAAQLVASVLHGCGLEVHLVTFGSMRAGNKAFRDELNDALATSARYVNYVDPVPRQPPIWFYWHVEGLCYFDSSGDMFRKLPFMSRVADVLMGAVAAVFRAIKTANPWRLAKTGKGVVSHHFMDSYIEQIEKYVEKRERNDNETVVNLPTKLN